MAGSLARWKQDFALDGAADPVQFSDTWEVRVTLVDLCETIG